MCFGAPGARAWLTNVANNMPNEPVFTCSFAFTKISVYPDRIEERKPFGFSKRVIPIKQISTILVSPLLGTARIETSGGAVHKFNIGFRKNLEAFEEAVRGLIS